MGYALLFSMNISMKKSLFLISVISLTGIFPGGSLLGEESVPLRIMSYNIRYDNPNDGIHRWDYRKNEVSKVLLKYSPDIIGIQEAEKHQLNFLDKALSHYSWVGVGRDDGKEKGEYTAIFYNIHRIKVLEDSTIWLSPTPKIPSKGWDADLNRTATWVKCKDRISGQVFAVINTHYDHQGEMARLNSSILIKKTLKRFTNGLPFILTGDFNMEPDSGPFQLITELSAPPRIYDTQDISFHEHQGPNGTFNGFGYKDTSLRKIDYIFVGEGVKVLTHRHVSDRYGENAISDHFPVVVDLLFIEKE